MKLQYDLPVCSHYLSALVNGDYTGLSDSDEAELNDWVAFIKRDLGTDRVEFFIDPLDCYNEPRFTVDDVTGLMADCYDVTVYTY